jgi:hypothetical protein
MRQIGHGRRNHRIASGFSLIETTVALGVVGLMTVFLYAGFSCGFGMLGMAQEDLRATQILMQQAEAIRLCRWSSLTNCPISFPTRYDPNSGPASNSSGVANRDASRAGTVYTCTITTNAASGVPDSAAYKTNMCQVTVTIYWTNYIGKQTVVRSRQMRTYVARYGIQNYIWGAQ